MEWIEESDFDRKRQTGSFRNIPRVHAIAERLENHGTVTFRSLGTGRCERVISGELRIKLPLLMRPIGMLAETIIHKQALVILDEEARAVGTILREGGL
jgi:hypothetical protein